MRRRALAVALALALTITSAFALTGLVVPGLWLARTLVVLGVAAATLLLLRSRTESATIPSLVALAAGTLSLSALFFGDTTVLGILPTQETVRAVVDGIGATVLEMRQSYPPLTTGDGVALLVAAGVLVVFVLVEMLGVGAFAPAWAGLPVLGLWCVPILLGAQVGPVVLALAALSYALLIAVQGRDDGVRRPDGRARRATALVVAGVMVASLVVAPLLLRLPAPVRWHPFYELVGSSTTRLDLGLGLRDDLLRSDDTPLLEYTGVDAEQMGPLHAYTVEEFTGNEWVRGPEGEPVPNAGQLLFPVGVDEDALGPRQVATVTIYDLGQDRLLLPGEPREVALDVSSAYIAAADEVVATIGREVSYGVTIAPRPLGEATLPELRPATDVPADLLEVPDTGYASDIAELTRQVVDDAGADTPYEQLLAIQNYLRDPGRFVYSTAIASPTTPDAVWDFLQDRHGYCVQFASAMVVMARSLGMPARLAVGFLPGETAPDGVTQVRADQAHAWPQVLFDGVGWVRFEPTPGVQAGPPPSYAPEPDPTAAPTTTTEPTATPSAVPTSTAGGSTQEAAGGSRDQDGGRAGAWVVALVLLGAVAAALSVLAARRARSRPRDIAERWQHVLAHVERLGVDTSPSRTPRAVARDAAEMLDEEAATAVSLLAGAVETVRYDRAGAARADDAEVDAWVETVVEAARARLRDRGPVGVGR